MRVNNRKGGGDITELIARGTFFSYILVFTLLPSIMLFKEKAHAAILKRRGKAPVYDDDAPDYNEEKRVMKRARHIQMMREKAAEFGFDYDPDAPFIDFKQIKADMAASRQKRAEQKHEQALLKRAKKEAKRQGVPYEEYLASLRASENDAENPADLTDPEDNAGAADKPADNGASGDPADTGATDKPASDTSALGSQSADDSRPE